MSTLSVLARQLQAEASRVVERKLDGISPMTDHGSALRNSLRNKHRIACEALDELLKAVEDKP